MKSLKKLEELGTQHDDKLNTGFVLLGVITICVNVAITTKPYMLILNIIDLILVLGLCVYALFLARVFIALKDADIQKSMNSKYALAYTISGLIFGILAVVKFILLIV